MNPFAPFKPFRRLKVSGSLMIGLTTVAILAPQGLAHFRLIEPASWLQETERGDPQKMARCGGTSDDPGKPSGKVTNIQGGDKLHLKIAETIYHPGFYRVALAVNSRDELPKDPVALTEASPNGPRAIAGAIQYPPMPPVIADGLLQHISKFDREQETDVEIPNITCSKCILQVIEFMAAHGLNKDGDYTYHHCAILQIRANPYKPVDTRFPAEKK